MILSKTKSKPFWTVNLIGVKATRHPYFRCSIFHKNLLFSKTTYKSLICDSSQISLRPQVNFAIICVVSNFCGMCWRCGRGEDYTTLLLSSGGSQDSHRASADVTKIQAVIIIFHAYWGQQFCLFFLSWRKH